MSRVSIEVTADELAELVDIARGGPYDLGSNGGAMVAGREWGVGDGYVFTALADVDLDADDIAQVFDDGTTELVDVAGQ